jgi:hypothetical protein
MHKLINIEEIYEQNLSFLIGSGASYGLFPTLELKIKGDDDSPQTIETLATQFEAEGLTKLKSLLFMHYYNECIKPVMTVNLSSIAGAGTQKTVLDNYSKFLNTLISIIYRRKTSDRYCNVYTTNYDSCLEYSADLLLKDGQFNFTINDGSSGFIHRQLHISNFKNQIYQKGVFDQHKIDIPQLNLIHLHGSRFWQKSEQGIAVDYNSDLAGYDIPTIFTNSLSIFKDIVLDPSKKVDDLKKATFDDIDGTAFWDFYNKLPIVNPTKWKFHETVFEEHYYQMLRFLSYELEKPNSTMITFGFSFSDEHILNLILRSISNPSLQILVCCFNDMEKARFNSLFKKFKNIQTVSVGKDLNFSEFNNSVFTMDTTK